jgi:chemotaxis signal transduction protein
MPLGRVFRIAAYASLSGQPDEYFRGWLKFHGQLAPVFDLNQVVCESPTPEAYGSRILLVQTAPQSPVPYVGLLAPGVTDTTSGDDPEVAPLDLDLYLQMLSTMIPETPAAEP